MSDERRSEGGGAIVVILVVLIVIGLLGVVGVGGGAFLFARIAAQEAREQERRALVEMNLAQMQAAIEQVEASKVAAARNAESQATPDAAPTDEIVLRIDAGGSYTLESKPLPADELPAALKQAKAAHPDGVRLKIQAPTEAPFERVEQAMSAGVSAGIIHQTVEVAPQP